MKKVIASIIRVISIPPVMILALVLILYACLQGEFASAGECIILVLFLGVFPLFAYPFQMLMSQNKKVERDKQRKMAFVFSLLGYTAAFIWAIVKHENTIILMITATYFLSVLLLTVLNKAMYIKASGHGCSFTAPILFISYYVSPKFLVPGAIFATAVCWASVYLKRHTRFQLLCGIMTAVFSFGLCVLASLLLN